MARSRRNIILFALGVALVTLAFSALVIEAARAQSLEEGRAWIHANAKDCCPHDRCFPVEADPGMTWWIVWGFKSQVRMGRERRWPFEKSFGCAYAHDPGTIRCLFVPTPEQS